MNYSPKGSGDLKNKNEIQNQVETPFSYWGSMTPSTKYPDDGRISIADQILDGRVVKTLAVDPGRKTPGV